MAKTKRPEPPVKKPTAAVRSDVGPIIVTSAPNMFGLAVVLFLFIWAALYLMKPIYVQLIINDVATGIVSTGKAALIAAISSLLIVALTSGILAVINKKA